MGSGGSEGLGRGPQVGLPELRGMAPRPEHSPDVTYLCFCLSPLPPASLPTQARLCCPAVSLLGGFAGAGSEGARRMPTSPGGLLCLLPLSSGAQEL